MKLKVSTYFLNFTYTAINLKIDQNEIYDAQEHIVELSKKYNQFGMVLLNNQNYNDCEKLFKAILIILDKYSGKDIM